MKTRYGMIVLLVAIFGLASVANGADLFVNKQGKDTNNGRSGAAAFLTIQKGVSVLKPGDTLTIGPGEYFENVKLQNFGNPDRQTVIRAQFPGTVILRGDRDVDLKFSLVPGQRFVYVADCKTEVLSVHEADTITNLAPSADRFALEFGPGRCFYDAKAKELYVSSSDFQPAERHHYTVGVLKDSGFHMFKCRGVVLDGLVASAYRTPVEREELLLPVSGFMLHECAQCVVRRCTAYFNSSGITINSGIGSRIDRPGAGRGNLIEDCVAYANRLDGIVAYNPSGETIRRCRSFLNQTYGARFYGGRAGNALCLMEDVIAWGNPGGDYWTKGGGLSGFFKEVLAERCVAFRGCMFGNFQHGLIGGGSQRGGGDRSSTIDLPEGHKEFHDFLDANFADALNYDFRLQGSSSLRNERAGNTHKGPYAYKPNIYYVKTNGNDARDGLSMANAFKTPAAALGKLKPGDTLYIAPGRYAGDLTVTARDVSIRGRGMDPVLIQGGLRLSNGQKVTLERLQFSGSVQVANSSDVEMHNCVFDDLGLQANGARNLRLTHNLFAGRLNLQGCSGVSLSGNLYAATLAVQTDSRNAVAYSSYNSYPQAEGCWNVGGKTLALDALQPRSDAQSVVLAPELSKEGRGIAVGNAYQFGGRGPLSTAIGPYREWKLKELDLMGPFVVSKTNTSADIEWWSTLPVKVELCWGETPECANRKEFTQNAFYSYGLTGLKPGKTYYVKIVPREITVNSDPARRFRITEMEAEPIKFLPGGEASSMKTEAPKASLALPTQLLAKRSAAHPATYYVATDGNDDADGLTRQTAWRSLQHAINDVYPGDTILLAGGKYPGTFYFRTTGEPNKPITVKAVPGEKVYINGLEETLQVGFVLYGKHHYRIDSLYFNGYAGIEDNVTGKEGGALVPCNCDGLQITRCSFSRGWGRCMEPHNCTNLMVKNCVFMGSMEAVMMYEASSLIIENCVFISPLILHLHVYRSPYIPAEEGAIVVRRCIFGENTRHKVHACPVSVGGTLSDNCYYMRWSQYDRLVAQGKTFPQLRAAGDTGSLYANPMMPGALGFRQGWQQIENDYRADDPYEPIEIKQLFPTNPEVILRDIGLQAEAFADFPFGKQDWPYTKEWAAKVKERMDAAEKLSNAGQNAKASTAYMDLSMNFPMSERLKTEVLDRAAECATRAKKYADAIKIAKTIPLEPFAIRRQMAILVEQKKFAEVTRLSPNPDTIVSSWFCPETEMVMADALYYLGTARARTGNMKAAENAMRKMVDKGGQFQYSPGATVLAVAWKRLGDFYRTEMKDKAKAREAYNKALETKSNPEIRTILEEARKARNNLR